MNSWTHFVLVFSHWQCAYKQEILVKVFNLDPVKHLVWDLHDDSYWRKKEGVSSPENRQQTAESEIQSVWGVGEVICKWTANMSHECHDTNARGGKSTHAIPSHRSMGSWGLSQSMDRILNLNSEGARSWSRLGGEDWIELTWKYKKEFKKRDVLLNYPWMSTDDEVEWIIWVCNTFIRLIKFLMTW